MAKTDYEQIMWPMLKAAKSGEISLSDAEKETSEQEGWVVNWASTADTYVQNRIHGKSKSPFQNADELLKFNIKKIKNITASLKWRNTLRFLRTVNVDSQ